MPDQSKQLATTHSATVTFGSITTLPGSAPRSGASASPTVTGASHQPFSVQARTPRVAKSSAYRSSAAAYSYGIAPSVWFARYVQVGRIGNLARSALSSASESGSLKVVMRAATQGTARVIWSIRTG